jgi:hypothetical protein
MRNVIKLTRFNVDGTRPTVLVGTESIIVVERTVYKSGGMEYPVTKIQSRGAMVHSTYVTQSVEEVYDLINS